VDIEKGKCEAIEDDDTDDDDDGDADDGDDDDDDGPGRGRGKQRNWQPNELALLNEIIRYF
jgi:hypothetical protein